MQLQSGRFAEMTYDGEAITDRRVDAGTSRGAADAEDAQLICCIAEQTRCALHRRGVCLHLLSECHRYGVREMRAAGLDHVRKLIAFGVECFAERVELRT